MPRFSVAFSKRKSASDDFQHAPIATPEQHSFRVIERNDVANVKSFDGGAKMARHSANMSANVTPKPNLLELNMDDNIFADLKANRGSGISNTTKTTSTDNSSRHSNASTAPSSTDFGTGSGQDEAHRYNTKQQPLPQSQPQPQPQPQPSSPPSRGGSKSSFLDRATRTFSFGGQKKHSIPPPKEDRIPDVPPILTLQRDEQRPRGMTASTSSTATPISAESSAMDLGGDFGSMFTSFDKRASVATLKSDEPVQPRVLTGQRHVQPAPISPDTVTAAEPLLGQRHQSAQDDAPPPVPRHQTMGGSFKYSHRPSDIVEDEDAKLLRESFTAMKFLSQDPNDSSARTGTQRYRRDEDTFTAAPSKPIASTFGKEDNMFEGSLSRFSKPSHRYVPRASNPPQNKVMTPAQFEKYRQDKERQGTTEHAAQSAAKDDEDEDEEEINYDDDDDEQEKSKQQAKQRRKQEAHMAVYRQQMMKVTGETVSAPISNRNSHPGLLPSTSAPQLGHLKAPSPEPVNLASDEDDDEDVPLGILQAHGFPNKNRPPTRLSHVGSNSNLRVSAQVIPPGRPASVMGDNASRRNSMLPAFARNLPQDPFVGAGIARPAVRESLAFSDAAQPPPPQGPAPPGGLVGVIVNEERSRAMRRGSPSLDNRGLMAGAGMSGPYGQGFDPVSGIPQQMMYNAGGMPGMPGMPQMHQMPPPTLTPGDQAQIQMTQQMQQFMQMQMQFMQMMAANQNGGNVPMQPPMQPPYGGGLTGNQSMVDLSSRHSVIGDPSMMDPRRMDHGMRTMSMVQPSSASFLPMAQYSAPSVRDSYAGYAPSIAPSERSNVGLPGRYRPVSQAAQSHMTGLNHGGSTMSGGLSGWSDDKAKPSVKAVAKANDVSDDDDEEGWEAMKAKREKKRSMWRSKKSYDNELAL